MVFLLIEATFDSVHLLWCQRRSTSAGSAASSIQYLRIATGGRADIGVIAGHTATTVSFFSPAVRKAGIGSHTYHQRTPAHEQQQRSIDKFCKCNTIQVFVMWSLVSESDLIDSTLSGRILLPFLCVTGSARIDFSGVGDHFYCRSCV